MTKYILQKPFLKWLGGKTQIIDNILDKIPNNIENYHDIFLGGGSVLFGILSLQKQNKININNKIYAYDINKDLINVYKNIQNNKEELWKYITKYISEYHNKGEVISKENYYYSIRDKYNNINKDTIECSALFMFLNKTCFRGMYREGPNGFNVPYGHYKKTPTIITKEDLDNINVLIKDVIFIHSDFCNSFKNIKSGDFVYLDPPYVPINKSSFVGYIKDGFSFENHVTLFNKIKELNNIKFIMNNSNVKLVLDNFSDYSIEYIKAKRAINSKNPDSTTTEVLIY